MGFRGSNFESFDPVEADVVLPEPEEKNEFDYDQWEADLEAEPYDEFSNDEGSEVLDDDSEDDDDPDGDFVNDTYNPDAAEVDSLEVSDEVSEEADHGEEPDDIEDDIYDPDRVVEEDDSESDSDSSDIRSELDNADFENDTYDPDGTFSQEELSLETDESSTSPDDDSDFDGDTYNPDGIDQNSISVSAESKVVAETEDPGEKDFANDIYDTEGLYHKSAEQDDRDGSVPGEKRFEDYSSEELGELARTDPEAARTLNDEYQERVSAKRLGMTPEEYRAHLQRIEDANKLDNSSDSPAGGNSYDTAKDNNPDNPDNPDNPPGHNPEPPYGEISGVKEIPYESPMVQEVLNETSMDSIRNNPEMISFENQLLDAADNHESGIGWDKFQELIKTPTGQLSSDEIKTIAEINDSVEMPSNDTLMSKVISESQYKNYISNGDYSSTIGGCLSKAQDMQDCYSFDDYYNKLGLNYSGNPYDNADKLYVVRYTSSDTENLVVRGYGGNTNEDLQKVQECLDIGPERTFKQEPPFQGTAHTLDVKGNMGKMEFFPTKDDQGNKQFCNIDNGSAIYEVSRDSSSERLVAVRQFDTWLKVRYEDENN